MIELKTVWRRLRLWRAGKSLFGLHAAEVRLKILELTEDGEPLFSEDELLGLFQREYARREEYVADRDAISRGIDADYKAQLERIFDQGLAPMGGYPSHPGFTAEHPRAKAFQAKWFPLAAEYGLAEMRRLYTEWQITGTLGSAIEARLKVLQRELPAWPEPLVKLREELTAAERAVWKARAARAKAVAPFDKAVAQAEKKVYDMRDAIKPRLVPEFGHARDGYGRYRWLEGPIGEEPFDGPEAA